MPLRGVEEAARTGREGLKISLEPIPGQTPQNLLGRNGFFFQTPPMEEFTRSHSHSHTDYDTIYSGQFSRPASRQLRSVSFETLVVDYAAWTFYNGVPIEEMGEKLIEICESGAPLLFTAAHDLPPNGYANWHMTLAGPEAQFPVTLRSLSITEKAGEGDTRYFRLELTEYRDPEVAGARGRALRRQGSADDGGAVHGRLREGRERPASRQPSGDAGNPAPAGEALLRGPVEVGHHRSGERDQELVGLQRARVLPRLPHDAQARWAACAVAAGCEQVPRGPCRQAEDPRHEWRQPQHERRHDRAGSIRAGRGSSASAGSDVASKKTKKIRVDLVKAYAKPSAPLRLNEQRFRFTLRRPDFDDELDIGPYLEQCEWRDEGSEDDVNAIPILRGSITLRKPHAKQTPMVIRDGHLIMCEVFWYAQWRPLWEMRLTQERVTVEDGTWSWELADDMLMLAGSNGSVTYKKGRKRRKRGYKYHEIVRLVARKYHVPLGQVAKGTEWIKSFSYDDEPLLELFRLALEKERKATGRRYVMRWGPISPSTAKKAAGRKQKKTVKQAKAARRPQFGLTIVPMRRNPILYYFRDQITSAQVGRDRRDTLATVIVAEGRVKTGKGKNQKTKKLKIRVAAKKALKRYGYIIREIKLGTVTSQKKARQRATRSLAKGLKPVRIIENFQHPGIAMLRRGDAMRVAIPEENYKGRSGVVFVTAVTHSVTASGYDMQLSLGFTDPMDPNKIKAEIEKAKRKSKSRGAGGGDGGGVTGKIFHEGDSLAVGTGPPLKTKLKNASLQTSAAVGRSSSQGLADLRSREGSAEHAADPARARTTPIRRASGRTSGGPRSRRRESGLLGEHRPEEPGRQYRFLPELRPERRGRKQLEAHDHRLQGRGGRQRHHAGR